MSTLKILQHALRAERFAVLARRRAMKAFAQQYREDWEKDYRDACEEHKKALDASRVARHYWHSLQP